MRDVVSMTCDADGGLAGGGDEIVGVAGVGINARCLLGTEGVIESWGGVAVRGGAVSVWQRVAIAPNASVRRSALMVDSIEVAGSTGGVRGFDQDRGGRIGCI